jgi:hypothetical protein
MWFLRMFFSDANALWKDGDKTAAEVVEQSLVVSDIAGLLTLRDEAYKFIDRINEQLVTRDV